MHAVDKPAFTAPCVARQPAPPAPTTTTSNVWSMNSYASAPVKFILFLDPPGLDADLQYGAGARDEQEASSAMFHCIHCIARPDLNARLNATAGLYRIAHIEWRTAARNKSLN